MGGAGADTLTGGSDADTFRIRNYETGLGASADSITDFVSGTDIIDLSGMDANSGQVGDQAFSFIGGGAFSNTAGELRYQSQGSDIWLSGDTDGDGLADFEILLVSAPPPVPADFLL